MGCGKAAYFVNKEIKRRIKNAVSAAASLPRLAFHCPDTVDKLYSRILSVSEVACLLQSKHWEKAKPVTFEVIP